MAFGDPVLVDPPLELLDQIPYTCEQPRSGLTNFTGNKIWSMSIYFKTFFQSFLKSLHGIYGLKGRKTTSTSKAGKILCMDDNSHSPNPIIYHMVLYTHSNTYEKEYPIQLLQNKNPGHKNKIPKLNQYTKLYQFLFYIQLWLVEIYKLFCSLFTFVVQLVLQNSHKLTPDDVTSLPIQKFTSVDYLSYLVMCIFQINKFYSLKAEF